jgi:hypothetical protein
VKRQFPWGCGSGQRKTETRIVWGPETIPVLLHPLQSQLLMSIQALKGRGLLGVKVEGAKKK